jgi:hypothetical protein
MMKDVLFLSPAIWFGSLLVAATTTAVCAADSQPRDDEDQPRTIRLVLHPAAEPRPALRYKFLPSLFEQRPGNAAVFYNKAGLVQRDSPDTDKDPQLQGEWLELPLDRLPRDEIATALKRWERVLKEISYATLREDCDWQMPVREGKPYAIILPELQGLRAFARVLAVKARLAIAEGRSEEAIDALRSGYTLAHHAAAGPTLIHALVGMAIANVMTEQARDLVQQPGVPNLYWAFTSLPHPFVDLRLANDYEADSLYFWHPEWRDLDRLDRTPTEWRRMFDDMVEMLGEVDTDTYGGAHRMVVIGRAIKQYAHAKQWLIDRGRSPEAVELMSVPQVVVLYTVGTFDELRDQAFKWKSLPLAQVREQFAAAEQSTFRQAGEREIVPLAQLLLPALQAATQAQARTERNFALLRTIEALRLYAAGHNGRLPERLADITEIPVPDDPWVGGPFEYRLSGNTATLETKSPPKFPARHFAYRFEISIAQ